MHILFVCTGNTCRSPMAAFLAQAEISRRQLGWTVESAGTHARSGLPITAEAAAALALRGIDGNGHVSRSLSRAAVQRATLVLAMTRQHATDIASKYPQAMEKTHSLLDWLSPDDTSSIGDIPDPFGQTPDYYELTARQLEDAVHRLLDRLAAADASDKEETT